MSILHLVATSDVHIGPRDTAVNADGENLGMVSNRRCREALLEYCKATRPHAGLFVGDLYKSAIGRPTQTEQWEATQFFHDWTEICPVYAKPGNHDIDGLRFGVHALQIFDAMNMRLVLLPKDGWTVIELERVKIGLYHGMLSNVRLESGMLSDSVTPNLPRVTDAPPADLYVLGDIHHRQFIGPNAAYCGAIDRLNFGEEDEVPGFWDIRIDTETKEITWKAIATPARRYVTVVDEDDVGVIDVQGAVTRFIGELHKLSEAEIKQQLLASGALEVSSVLNTSEYAEAQSLYSSFAPAEAFDIWLEAQSHISKADRDIAKGLLQELLA